MGGTLNAEKCLWVSVKCGGEAEEEDDATEGQLWRPLLRVEAAEVMKMCVSVEWMVRWVWCVVCVLVSFVNVEWIQ